MGHELFHYLPQGTIKHDTIYLSDGVSNFKVLA
jgi:hypothetical protein